MARRRRSAKPPREDEQPTGLRIVAGRFRGAKLTTPPSRILRPMREHVRQALFNILGPGAAEGETVLDLFAGSGSLGLEALSRGARRAVFVDNNPACLAVLGENVAKLGVEEEAIPVRHDLGRGVEPLRAHGPYGLVFVHPPFALLRAPPGPGEPHLPTLLGQLVAAEGLLEPEAVLAFETPRECFESLEELEAAGLTIELRREYGTTALFVAGVAAGAAGG